MTEGVPVAAQAGQPTGPTIAQGLFSYQIGGSERVGADVAKAYRQRGYRSLCFAFYDSSGPIRDELEAAGVPCFDLNFERGHRLTRRVSYQFAMYRWLRREHVRALHVHHATALMLAGLAAKAAHVARVVMTEHALHQLRERPRYRREARLFCPLADAITVVHPALEGFFLESMGTPRHKLHYVANGVAITGRDEPMRRQLRGEHGLADDHFLFLFAGRLQAVKDLPTLLRAFARVSAGTPRPCTLWMAGDGAERAALEALARELNLGPRIRFLGPRGDVRRLMSAADAFVMSSVTEGLPMVLLEAMATHLPCIATAVGGIPQLLEGCGSVVPPQNPEALAGAMLAVLADPAQAAAMAKAGIIRVRAENDLEKVVDTYLGLLGLPPRWGAGTPAGAA